MGVSGRFYWRLQGLREVSEKFQGVLGGFWGFMDISVEFKISLRESQVHFLRSLMVLDFWWTSEFHRVHIR